MIFLPEPGVFGLFFKFDDEEFLMTVMFAQDDAFLNNY
jgi:hypothetical protein